MKNSLSFPSRPTSRTWFLGAVGVALLAAVSSAASPSRFRTASACSLMSSYAPEPLAGDTLRESERAFLAKAIEATRQQMKLAAVGASQADSAEVRSHALQLAADFRELNDALEALVRRKGGIPGAPVGGTSENYAKLMEKSGSAFDREFVRAAAESSVAVMTLFEYGAADAKDADVRELAASELPVLRLHRNAIESLKKTID